MRGFLEQHRPTGLDRPCSDDGADCAAPRACSDDGADRAASGTRSTAAGSDEYGADTTARTAAARVQGEPRQLQHERRLLRFFDPRELLREHRRHARRHLRDRVHLGLGVQQRLLRAPQKRRLRVRARQPMPNDVRR
jgi:hypothetical protein